MGELLIRGGTVATMDPTRQVIKDGAVRVRGNRIVAVGPARALDQETDGVTVLDATGMLVLPGLIDCHGHAGHGLVKTLGGGRGDLWFDACRQIYTTGSTPAFWEAEALLSALERIKAGVTTGVSYLGGGDSVTRTDAPDYAAAHCAAVQRIGARSIVAVGANRPPFPWMYAHIREGLAELFEVSFERQLEVCEAIVAAWQGAAQGRVMISLTCPVHHPSRELPEGVAVEMVRDQARAIRDLARRLGVSFTQDGHRQGSIEAAHQWELLGPDAYLSHCVDITEREIAICAETDTRIVHNPSAVASIKGRCPVPELLDAGVTVAIGSDGAAPDRSFDQFRHMQQCMHYHRRHFRDDQVMPPGKVLEMVTIDAARTLGLEDDIGSLEIGKKADIVLLDLRKPHLAPANMPLYRATCFANGADIDTTIIDGEIVMQGRRVASIDEGEVLDYADREAALAIERCGLGDLLETPASF
ncbi:MAG: amidohydrolase family protein, partial [Proteobacteria bacterium]|nr:amidohydrolase family protein [Pseudomonadota bacterium]